MSIKDMIRFEEYELKGFIKTILYLILTALFVCLLFPISEGALTDKLISCWNMDDADAHDELNNYDMTTLNANYEPGDYKLGNASFNYSGTSDLQRIGFGTQMMGTGYNTTIAMWVKLTTSGSNQVPFEQQSGSNTDRFIFWKSTDNKMNFFLDGAYRTSTNAMNLSQWYFLVGTVNGTHAKFYLDSVLQGLPLAYTAKNTNNLIGFGENLQDNADHWLGNIDDTCIWNRTLKVSEIQELYNSGLGFMYPYTDIPVLDIKTSLNNTVNFNDASYFFTFNVTASFTDDTGYCSIYKNDVFNETVLVNFTRNSYKNYTFPLPVALYNITMNCSTVNATDDIPYYYIRVDQTSPVIRSDFINNTVFNVTDVFRFYVNFTDENLFAYNISFINDDNSIFLDNIFAENLTSSFAANETSFVLTALDITSNVSIIIQAWDSHTGKILKDSATVKGNLLSYRQLDFWCNNSIRTQTIYTHEKITPEVQFISEDFEHTCYFSLNSGDFIQVKDSPYRNHFVSLSEKIWIDESNEDVDIKMLSSNLLELKYKGLKTDRLSFNSIGDLNYNTVTYRFTVQEQESLSDILLQAIKNDTAYLPLIYEAIKMIWIIGLWGYVMLYYKKLITERQLVLAFFLSIFMLPLDIFMFDYMNDADNFYLGMFFMLFMVLRWSMLFLYSMKK